jgi:hypothetical protein
MARLTLHSYSYETKQSNGVMCVCVCVCVEYKDVHEYIFHSVVISCLVL